MKKRFSFLLMAFFLAISGFAQNLLNEGFEGTTFPPAYWTQQNVSGNSFARSTTYHNTGNASAFVNWSSDGSETWLITPSLTPEEGDSIIFYYTANDPDYYGGSTTFTVEVLTSNTDLNSPTLLYTVSSVTSSFQRVAISLSDYVGQNIFIGFHYVDNYGTGIAIDDISGVHMTPITCPAPSDVAVSDLDQTSATISWTENGDATDWTIYLKADADAAYTEYSATSNPYTISDLSSQTHYTAYVVANCSGDDNSLASPMVSFQTPCGGGWSVPYTNNFDADGQSSIDCWTKVIEASGFPNIVEYTSACYSGAHALEFKQGNCLIALQAPNDDVDLSSLRVKFYYRVNSTPGVLEFGVMSSVTDTSTFTPLDTLLTTTGSFTSSTSSYNWNFENLSLAGLTGNEGSYLAFRYTSVYSNNSWYIDDFTIEELPSCAGINYSSVAASEITETGATITFTDPDDSHSSWNIYYREHGNNGEWTMENTTDTSYALTGLESATVYDVFVLTSCGSEQATDTSAILTFMTSCAAETIAAGAPYTNNFSTEYNDDCFTSVYGNEPNVENGYLQLNAGYSYSTGGNTMMFTLPQFTNDINTLRIAFDVSRPYTWYDFGTLVVGVMSDPTDSTTFEAINTVTTTSITGEHFVIPFNLTNIVTGENNYIAFKYTQGGYYAGRIDNLVVSLIPNCMGPDYESGIVSNITNNSATFSFTDSDTTHSSWNVYYSDGTTTNSVETDSTTITLTGLTAGTSYTVWAKTDCGSEESEDSTVAVTFCTKGNPVSTDYVQNFEEDDITDFSMGSNSNNIWVIGSAISNPVDSTDTKSLYVSDNGGTSNHYAYSPDYYTDYYTYAAVTVNFGDMAEYNLSFDYTAPGGSSYSSSYGSLRAYLLDENAELPTNDWPTGTQLLGDTYNQSSWNTFQTTLPDVANTTKQLVFVWMNGNYGSNQAGPAIDNISIIGRNCAKPTNLRQESNDETSATLAWHQSGESLDWALYYRQVAAGDAEQTWTAITATDTTYTITGLTNNTQYEAYVVANCTDEDTSTATSTINFYTTPVLINVGDSYTQDFSNTAFMDSLVYNAPTDHWTIGAGPYATYDTVVNADSTLTITMNNPTGNQALYITDDTLGTYHYNYTSPSTAYAVLPLKLGNKEEYQISFDYKVGGNFYAVPYIYLAPANQQATGSLSNAVVLLNGTTSVSDWTNVQYTLQHASNKSYYLRFEWQNLGYTWSGDGNPPIAIDNLQIIGNDCAQPTNLVVDSVTDESAYLSWTENGSSNNWTVYYKLVPGGTEQTLTSGMVKDENNKVTVALTGLAAGAQYSAYVVSNCTENSNPTEEVAFSTLGQMISDFPYELHFEDSTENNVFTVTGTGVNGWFIGNGMGVDDEYGDGTTTHSLYISNDNGVTNAYTRSSTQAYAAMNLQFGDATEYSLEFDYHVGGFETQDNMYVYLVPTGNSITNISAAGNIVLMNAQTGVNSWQHAYYKLPGVSGQAYQLVFYWHNSSGTSSYEPAPAIDNIKINEGFCYSADTLIFNNANFNDITLSWTVDADAPSAPSSWTIKYKYSGAMDTEIQEMLVDGSATSATITGLTSGTDYLIWLYANCDEMDEDEEEYNGDMSIANYTLQTTMCDPIDATSGWYDGFDISLYQGNRAYPKCWTRLKTSYVDAPYPSIITYAQTGYNPSNFPTYTGDETSMEWKGAGTIATPYFSGEITNYRLQFQAMRNGSGSLGDNGGFNAGMWVYVASDIYDTTTWEPIRYIEPSELDNWKYVPGGFTFNFNNVINTGTNKAIILEYLDNTTYSWYLDAFRMSYVGNNFDPTCSAPTNGQVTGSTVDSEDVTIAPNENDVTITWSAGGAEKRWDYKINLSGKFAATDSTTATFTNLIPGTEYTAYVRAHCVDINPIYGDDSTTVIGYDTVDNGEFSPWLSIPFTTAGIAPDDCPEVSGIVVDSVSEHTVTVSWTGSDNAVGYRVAISTLGSYQYLQASDIQSTTNTSYTFSGLTDTTEYTVYVYAVCQYNNSGWDSIAATTLKQYVPAAVTTNAATNIDSTSVTLNGHVNANSDVISTRGFKLKKYTETDLQAQTLVSTDAASNFTYDATGLESQTQYSYKAYVTTDAGNTIEGAWETFTTLAWIPNAPVVVTDSLTNIDSTSATFNASMTLGDEAVTSKGFAYKTVGGTETRVTVSGDNFTYNVTGLAPYTNYEVYAWARTATYNTNTTEARGAVVSFTTLASATTIIPPTVTTLAVSNLDSTSVTFNGAVEQQTESILSKGFVYRVNNATDSTIRTVVGEEFSYNEIDLLPSTNYVVYAYATTASGTTRGANVMFTTLAAPIVAPTVTTLPAENVDSTTASLRGTIVQGSEAIIARGFKYWSQTNSNMVMTANATGLNMTANISNLTPSTTYVYYAYVITATDTTKGANVMFTTNQGVIVNPTVVTLMATNIGQTSATINGQVSGGNQTITDQGFVYRVSGATDSVKAEANGENMSLNLINLTCGTEYTYYAYATTENGETITGENRTFTTSECDITAPTVTTLSASEISDHNATLNGQVTVGSEEILEQGFEYKVSTENTWQTIAANDNFTATINNLTSGTTYTFRAYVTTATDTYRGSDMTFTTTSGLLDVTDNVIISAYPNPTVSDVTLKIEGLTEEAQIILTDVQGKTISEQRLPVNQTTMTISTNGLSSGVYYIRVITDNMTRVEKLIKR